MIWRIWWSRRVFTSLTSSLVGLNIRIRFWSVSREKSLLVYFFFFASFSFLLLLLYVCCMGSLYFMKNCLKLHLQCRCNDNSTALLCVRVELFYVWNTAGTSLLISIYDHTFPRREIICKCKQAGLLLKGRKNIYSIPRRTIRVRSFSLSQLTAAVCLFVFGKCSWFSNFQLCRVL